MSKNSIFVLNHTSLVFFTAEWPTLFQFSVRGTKLDRAGNQPKKKAPNPPEKEEFQDFDLNEI